MPQNFNFDKDFCLFLEKDVSTMNTERSMLLIKYFQVVVMREKKILSTDTITPTHA